MTVPPLPSPESIWRRYDRDEVRLSAPLSARMIALAGLEPGMRVLDLATGRGEPAIPAAHVVGPHGAVVGVDVAAAMLAMARERADQEGVANLDLRVGDASSLDLRVEPPFDATLIRWGLMYMDAPIAALEAARAAMVSGARLVIAVWAEPERVPYYTWPREVLARFAPQPPIGDGRGTFRYADAARLSEDVEAAGFAVEHVEELEVPVMEAQTGEEAVAWARAFGITRAMADLPDAVQRAWEEAFAGEAEARRRDGVIQMGGVTRVVVATPRS